MDEPDGFRDFVDERSRTLLWAGWLLTGNWAAAEDLVQTALAAAWQRWPRATSNGTPEAYVRAIMTTTYLGWRRRRWHGETPVEHLPEPTGSGARDDFDSLDTRRSVIEVLSVLSRQQRGAVVLRYFADLSEAQTAAAMGCSVGAVKSHTSRALNRLRDEPSIAQILTGEVTS